jgi:1-acyl-sn-glycerol-3-phosphate acyltransferase
MIAVRSVLFLVAAGAWTALLAVLYLPLLLLPRLWMQRGARVWVRGVLALLALFCRLIWRVEGAEHIPAVPSIIAAKHQSAWDTLIFHLLVDDPVFVLKRELFRVPLFGWYLWKAGNIGVERSAGAAAIRHMLPGAERRLAEGATLIIFPEGTRAAPGEALPYHPGVAALYSCFDVPLMPVALNSGLFWGRRSIRKRPGVIRIRFLEPVPPGLGRRRLLELLQDRIEQESGRLVAEVQPGGGPEA